MLALSLFALTLATPADTPPTPPHDCAAHGGHPRLDLDPEAARRRGRAIRGRFRRGPAQPLGPGGVVIATPRFLWVSDVARTLPAAPWTTDAAYAEAFEMARDAWEGLEPDGARTLLVFATFDAGDRQLFYTALSNDVRGLGEGDEAALFDDSPGSTLEGYAWMGSLEGLDAAGPNFATEAFLHEIAHRWGIYVRVNRPGLPADVLLGRNATHFSFLADTDNSPMEGNRWSPQGERWTTSFDAPPEFRFSPLELYLMGLIPPTEVPPIRVLGPLTRIEPAWFRVNASTPPAHRLEIEVSGETERTDLVTIQDIIAAAGPRRPPAPSSTAPVVRKAAVILLSDGRANPTPERLKAFDNRLQSWVAAFAVATGGRMTLDIDVGSAGLGGLGAPCDDVDGCDRRVADACMLDASGKYRCTRACAVHADCNGLCCVGSSVPGQCAPAPDSRACGTAPGSGPDLGPTPVAGSDLGRSDIGGLEPPRSNGCRSTMGGQQTLGALLLVLSLMARRRRFRPEAPQRGAPGSPPGYRPPRRRVRPSTARR